ncbi:MAG: LamG domain-containing protein [Planctomycetes bacterium]|nr:LamG domain-containing protein [Planctomycetota bacterium]
MYRKLVLLTVVLALGLVSSVSAADPNLQLGLIGYWGFDIPNDLGDGYGEDRTSLCDDCDPEYMVDGNCVITGTSDEFLEAYAADYKPDYNTYTRPLRGTLPDGNDNYVLDLDGVADYVLLRPGGNFMDVSGAPGVTLACWMKTEDLGSGDRILGKGYGWTLRGGWSGRDGRGKPTIQCMNTVPTEGQLSTDKRWDDNKWHHVAGTYDGSNYRIYVDGAEAATPLAATGAISGAIGYDMAIGAYYAGQDPKGHYGGFVDEPRIYKRACSQREIQMMMGADPEKSFPINPRDKDIDVLPDVVLEWWAGDDANDVARGDDLGNQVYFGTSLTDVCDATTATAGIYRGAQDGLTYDPPEQLDPNTLFYWRVDNVNDSTSPYVWKGDVFEFTTTTGRAMDPAPYDAETNVNKDVVLSWTAGAYVNAIDGHDVYFGTSPEFVQTQSGTTYDPSPAGYLEMGETYYWKIVEVNDGGFDDANGPIWSFTVSDYTAIDDFEGYEDSDDLQLTWDGTGNATPYLDTVTFHEDANSMEIDYGNDGTSPYSSTVERTFSSAQDWTDGDVTALTIYFHGLQSTSQHPANDDEDLFVRITDDDGTPHSATVQWSGDPCALSNEFEDGSWNERWYQWSIPLSSFSGGGVTLTNVKKIAIIVGDGSAPGGDGFLYIDDIRLYVPWCIKDDDGRAIYALGDFTGDCDSDYGDLKQLQNDWLLSDRLETDFNGILDPNFHDNGNGWVTGNGGTGTALQFDGEKDWMDISDGVLNDFQDKTIAMWVRMDASDANEDDAYLLGSYHSKQRLNIFFGGSASAVSGVVTDKIYLHVGGTDASGQNLGLASSASTVSVGTWTHVAATIWNRTDGYARGELFINGLPIEVTDNSFPRLVGPLIGANLGSYNDGSTHFGDMTIDDFRIYGSVLSDADVNDVMTDTYVGTKYLWYKLDNADANDLIAVESGVVGKSYNTKLDVDSETYEGEAIGSRYVNFRDYAHMANNWLAGYDLWP